MKRIISLLLSIALLFSCGIIMTNAETDKLAEELQLILNNSEPNTIVRFYITINGWDKTLTDMPSYGDREFWKAYDEFDEYRETRDEMILPQILGDITPLRIVNEDYNGSIVLETTVTNIERIADNELVREVGYCNFTFYPYGEKAEISDELQAILDKSAPDDSIPVMITFSDTALTVEDMPSWPDTVEAQKEYRKYKSARYGFLGPRVLDGAECQIEYQSVRFWLVTARAEDIPTFAESGYVRAIAYWDKSQQFIEHPEKIDPQVIGYFNCDVTEQTVFIELDLESKVPKEMPSWPDYNKATREYEEYFWSRQKDFERIIEELKSSTHMRNVRGVCHEAVIATVGNDPTSISELAMNEHVKYIRCFDLYSKEYDESNTRNRYRDRLLKQYPIHDTYTGDPLILYQEVCYHPYNGDDKPYGTDWAIVQASISGIVACAELEQIVGGRLLYAPNTFQKPFAFDIGLYDAKQDKFFDITEVDFDDYPDLYEVWQKMDIGELTVKETVGDADGDSTVTILDATKVQRGVAGLESKNTIVATGADADGDGEMTVLDATRIQRYKAELCTLDGTEIAEKA